MSDASVISLNLEKSKRKASLLLCVDAGLFILSEKDEITLGLRLSPKDILSRSIETHGESTSGLY